MSSKSNGNKNPKSAKVLKLGFNISVSGDPGSDYEIVLDDKEQKCIDSSSSKGEQFHYLDAVEYPTTDMPKHELEKTKTDEVSHGQSTGAIPKQRKSTKSIHSSESPQTSESEKTDKDLNLIDQIKNTMEHLDKFSDHIKEIPRLRNHPLATSTPLADKFNSKSDSNLIYPQYKPRKFSHCYDFYSRKDYFKSSVRPLHSDLFLKPLPAEGYYKRGIYSRFFDLEPYRHFGSDNSLNKSSDYKSICTKSNSDIEKYEECNFPLESSSGKFKKFDGESGDKHSTSSADSIKDIKIYQSGGILIMQNFKDNLDFSEKKEMSEFSAKLIENCNKLKMEVTGFQDDLPAIGNSSDENKNLGKMVQFDLSSFEGQKSKSGDSSSNAARDESSLRMESSESTSDCMKKDSSPQGTSQSQDFPSISTQENDSIISNQPGMSPSYASSKKLEWDSGADIGYLNLDLTKENLSTIEKIVLKGLSSDGKSEKNVVYEKQPEQNQTNRSKFVLERMPSELVIEEISDGASNSKNVSAGSKRESGSRKLSRDETESPKGDSRAKFEETKLSSNEDSAKEKPTETHPKGKPAETTDKSVNVNTLFDNIDFKTPLNQSVPLELIRPSQSPTKPKIKKSPKIKTPKNKNRLLRAPKKVTPPPPRPASLAMGVPKKVYKKVEATPALNDVELSREVEEIIIDQRFKIKQNVHGSKESELKDKGVKEVKAKVRPISASSATSNNTVLHKYEEKTKATTKVIDQVIQTSDYDCESVGIQAFSSRKSSDFDFESFKKTGRKAEKTKETVNTSSKNIQAFGLNSSLPKQLEHPKGAETVTNQHTKSTQFYGGAINSLPNYHSNLVTKPGESCGRMPNILKTKKNSEAEIIRLKEENRKNILANDSLSEPKTHSKTVSSIANKENLISKKSTNSKRSHGSRRTSKGNGTASQESELKDSDEKGKKKSPSVECSDCPHTSDEVSSMILTSEVLKVHGDSIDRNIIKEKYFQSQLVELEKRKMISRSTSMDMQLQPEDEPVSKVYTTTGCQYSPQSRGTTSGERYQEPEGDSSKENPNGKTQKPSLEQYGTAKSTQLGAGDSLPSSTQTAHSWVPGVQNSRENSTGVGRARSFEYLPGHIYESSGNLREELPSETERNLITSSSESDIGKRSASAPGDKDSEGRHTLILENSSESSQNSNRMKILDENLTRLSTALLRFWEKDAQVQSITQSLFMNFWKKSGSGDWFPPARSNTSKTGGESQVEQDNSEKKRSDTLSGSGEQEPKQPKDLSIACQTDGKSPPSVAEKFYESKKALEKRISEEKKSQIKWIENEIHHLNILRKLLEKQNSPGYRKKKQLPESNETSKTEEPMKALTEIRPAPVTSVYGCTVTLDDNEQEDFGQMDPRMMQRGFYQPQYGYQNTSECVSLTSNQNNWQNSMYSVGIQAAMSDPNSLQNQNWGEMDNFCPPNSRYVEPMVLPEQYQSDVNTQFPSARGNDLMSMQNDFPSGNCNSCNNENCFCLDFSEGSLSSASQSVRSRRSEKKGIRCAPCIDNRSKTGNSTDPEFRVMECGPVYQPERTNGQNDDFPVIPKSVQGSSCKCQNCPKRLSSALNKAGIVCRGNCTTNAYVNCEKPPEVVSDCRCSKVQPQKSSNCACHLIKIHGTKCCSSDRCRRRCCSKRTENQSCQTDSVLELQHPTKETELQEERANYDHGRRERINSEAEYHRRLSPVDENATMKTSDGFVDETSKKSSLGSMNDKGGGRPAAPSCSCRRKAEKERAKVDDHPRHYFLRIEEKEVDSIESMEQKKSLEVITVTVPVKKAGKGKIYGNGTRQSDMTTANDILRPEEPSSGCNCCAECIEGHRKQMPDYGPGSSVNYRRAEKPESPTRTSSKQTFDTGNFYEEFCYPSKEPSQQEFYREGMKASAPPDSYLGGTVNYTPEPQCCESCNCINRNMSPPREYQTEYNSHKKNRYPKEYQEGNARFYETRQADGRYRSDAQRNGQEQSSQYGYRGQELNPEYYNYNKREFMTKSEILKEEKQKKKVHQPTLQECLSSNRPDFYNSAERRRNIISKRAEDRIKKHKSRMECLMNLMHQCNEKSSDGEPKRIFTTVQMREQTMKRYRNLPEVTGKLADQKKKEEYRTNRLMAEIFAKKLQTEALKGKCCVCKLEKLALKSSAPKFESIQ